MIPSLADLLADWLQTYTKRKFLFFVGRRYVTDDDLIRCSSCKCFTAFIEPTSLILRLGCPNYQEIFAADPEFFDKLSAHLDKHICS